MSKCPLLISLLMGRCFIKEEREGLGPVVVIVSGDLGAFGGSPKAIQFLS